MLVDLVILFIHSFIHSGVRIMRQQHARERIQAGQRAWSPIGHSRGHRACTNTHMHIAISEQSRPSKNTATARTHTHTHTQWRHCRHISLDRSLRPAILQDELAQFAAQLVDLRLERLVLRPTDADALRHLLRVSEAAALAGGRDELAAAQDLVGARVERERADRRVVRAKVDLGRGAGQLEDGAVGVGRGGFGRGRRGRWWWRWWR